jgi:hypothetical protein
MRSLFRVKFANTSLETSRWRWSSRFIHHHSSRGDHEKDQKSGWFEASP